MKKFMIILLISFLAISTVSAFDISRFSVGAAFGTSGSSEKSSQTKEVINSSKFGFVVRVRADYKFAENYTATLMISYDSPNKAVIAEKFRATELNVANNMKYLKIYLGASRHFIATDNLLVAIGVGPELSIDLTNGAVGACATVYGRFSYALTGSKLSFDSIVKGSMEWIKDLPDEDTHFYLDGDVSLGFTYYF